VTEAGFLVVESIFISKTVVLQIGLELGDLCDWRGVREFYRNEISRHSPDHWWDQSSIIF
jgi:hypothetical protein